MSGRGGDRGQAASCVAWAGSRDDDEGVGQMLGRLAQGFVAKSFVDASPKKGC